MREILKLRPPAEALKTWLQALPQSQIRSEEIETIHASGRVTIRDLSAPHPLPEFSRSAMDGYAVRASDTVGASENAPIHLKLTGEVLMGQKTEIVLGSSQAALIHTGGMLPANADAVVMVEFTRSKRKDEIEILRPVAPLENTLMKGEDVKTGDVVIKHGARLRAAEIGGLLSFGWLSVQVACKPRIAIISSGDEVVPPETAPEIGQVRDINSYSLSILIQEWGGTPVRYGIVPDKIEDLTSTLRKALTECDGVMITAGSSVSNRDLTVQVIQQAGQPGVLVHGLNIRPGKPTILAVCDGKPVIGLPGNPISSLVIAWLFMPAILARLQGMTGEIIKNQVQARLSENVASQTGREDWVPVKITAEKNGYLAEPIFFKSNLIFNLASADGLMYIPAEANGACAGETVRVYLR